MGIPVRDRLFMPTPQSGSSLEGGGEAGATRRRIIVPYFSWDWTYLVTQSLWSNLPGKKQGRIADGAGPKQDDFPCIWGTGTR